MNDLLVLATEGGIPTSNPWSQLAVPIGILIFVGSVYMLLRSNLGTRRGYLVMSCCLWGFAFLLSLLWTFGAPGTPATTGPQNLPGQELDEYQPVWVPFAEDSTVATEEGSPYAAIANYPEGWGEVPADFAEEAAIGVQNTQSFFGSLDGLNTDYFNPLVGTEEVVGEPLYAEADNGRPMIAATFVNTCEMEQVEGEDEGVVELPAYCADEGLEVGAPVPEGAVDGDGEEARQEQTFFAFFDAGAPYFPSLLMNAILGILFAIHMVLLARDERRERREMGVTTREVEVEERDTVAV
ncbi:hypothetical protein BH24ACT15_BH24ACT15_11260 [soil metagenome]